MYLLDLLGIGLREIGTKVRTHSFTQPLHSIHLCKNKKCNIIIESYV